MDNKVSDLFNPMEEFPDRETIKKTLKIRWSQTCALPERPPRPAGAVVRSSHVAPRPAPTRRARATQLQYVFVYRNSNTCVDVHLVHKSVSNRFSTGIPYEIESEFVNQSS